MGGVSPTSPSINGIINVIITTFWSQNDHFRGHFGSLKPSFSSRVPLTAPRLKVVVQDGLGSRVAPRGVQGQSRDPAEKKI